MNMSFEDKDEDKGNVNTSQIMQEIVEWENTNQILLLLSCDEVDKNNRKWHEDDWWRDQLSQFEDTATNDMAMMILLLLMMQMTEHR